MLFMGNCDHCLLFKQLNIYVVIMFYRFTHQLSKEQYYRKLAECCWLCNFVCLKRQLELSILTEDFREVSWLPNRQLLRFLLTLWWRFSKVVHIPSGSAGLLMVWQSSHAILFSKLICQIFFIFCKKLGVNFSGNISTIST